MTVRALCLIFLVTWITSCDQDTTEPIADSTLYFPPIDDVEWTTQSIESLNWNSSEEASLYQFLSENGTRAFIVLKEGKIVMERYWGSELVGGQSFGQSSRWYWASASKTMIATLVGIAQEQGLLSIQDKTSDYLSDHWTSAPIEKENMITIADQLSMSTGLDYEVDNLDCISPECLLYKSDAGSQWFYHNGPYTLLHHVLEQATSTSLEDYSATQLESPIGMNGRWFQGQENQYYLGSARDAARFGLLLLNHGNWAGVSVLSDGQYFDQMTRASQAMNPSYGYLTWLNGQSKIIYPGIAQSISGMLSPEAPSDMFAALGKNGQFIDIIPSEDLVVVRLGEAPSNALVPITFHNAMWERLNRIIN